MLYQYNYGYKICTGMWKLSRYTVYDSQYEDFGKNIRQEHKK